MDTRRLIHSISLAFLLLVPAAPLEAAKAELRPQKLAEMDEAIERAIEAGRCPGGVLWVEHEGQVYSKAYGKRSLIPVPEPVTADTIFDAASLTKVVACTPAVMLLVERGDI